MLLSLKLTCLFFYCSIILIYQTNSQCTTIAADTCYIDRLKTWTPSDSNMFQCEGQLKKCVVTCSGQDMSCSSGDTGQHIYIICPVDAVSCIIECQSTKSCQGIIVLATTSKYTQINIGAMTAGKGMTIYSPGSNGGHLSINLENDNADFYESTIIAQQNASIIDINCDIGNLCSNNTINGQRVESNAAIITLYCNALHSADCSNTKLYCSDDTRITSQKAFCNIDCESCTGSQLLIWDTLHKKWVYQADTSSTTSNVSLDTITSIDPLYYVIFVLTLSLCCVVCILLFWIYHQRKFSKEMNYDDNSNFKITNLSPRILPNASTASKSNASSCVTPHSVSTHSNNSLREDQNSLVLEANTIFNPNHTKHHNDNERTMGGANVNTPLKPAKCALPPQYKTPIIPKSLTVPIQKRRHIAIATSIMSELTEITEVTEMTEQTESMEQSYYSSSESSETEYTEATRTTFVTSNNSSIYNDNSRITYDGTMKEIVIKSDVLDADIMDNLYDNKIKPMIDALKEEYDGDSSSNPPSPQSVTLND